MGKTKETTLSKIMDGILSPKGKYFFIFIILVMFLVPYFLKPGLPVYITPETEKWYETMDALGPDDVVLFSWEVGPAVIITDADFIIPAYKHLFTKPGLKIVFCTLRNPQAMPILLDIWDGKWGSGGLWEKEGKYGEEYVFLGYLPGLDTATAAMAKDMHGAAGGKDHFGTSLSDLPMMDDIRDWQDVTLIIETGNVEEGPWMRQWTIPYGSVLCELTSLSAYAWLLPWYEAGLITAMLGGVRAGAEYEYLLGIPGHAMRTMDVVSLSAIIFISAIIVRNILYRIQRQTQMGGKE
jgi:hypothetical protein